MVPYRPLTPRPKGTPANFLPTVPNPFLWDSRLIFRCSSKPLAFLFGFLYGGSMPAKSSPPDTLPLLANGYPDTPHGRFRMRRDLREATLKKETAQETLAARMMARLDAVQTYLDDDDVWFAKLEKAPLRDVAIMEGVWIDKLQLLTGKATQTISHQHQDKLDARSKSVV